MPKMKRLLRKLHIDSDHTNRLTATSTSSQPPSLSPRTGAIGAVDSLSLANINNDSNCSDVEFSFYEEEFQMQLALAISVSSGSTEATARLPQAPESVVEFLSLRYWSNNVVNYDEKVTDGFYDVYGIASNSVTRGKMPSLVDLQARTGTDDVYYEVTLVDRRTDKELQHLEERVSNVSLECQATGMSQIISRLVVKIAVIVVAHMGGPVNDADEMSRRWTRSYELRNTLKTVPLGSIDCGLSHHRALLFKVLNVFALLSGISF